MQEVPAGNILAIAGLDLAILKSATVASTPLCRPLAPMLFQARPLAPGWQDPAAAAAAAACTLYFAGSRVIAPSLVLD